MGVFSGLYNTELTPSEEAQYRSWILAMNVARGRNIGADQEDYDTRGYWKNFVKAGKTEPDKFVVADDGLRMTSGSHGPDTFKKPNHPTFSTESVYSNNQWQGGSWGQEGDKPFFVPGRANMETWTPEARAKYFQRAEPDIELREPTPSIDDQKIALLKRFVAMRGLMSRK
jgi:hypothetical protein